MTRGAVRRGPGIRAAITLAIPGLLLITGCTAQVESNDAAAPDRQAAAVECTDKTRGYGVRTAVYAFKNLTDVDLVYDASAPNCDKWSGTWFPANYNGTEIPVMQAKDEAKPLALIPNPWVAETDMTKVGTTFAFNRLDGTLVGEATAFMNWRANAIELMGKPPEQARGSVVELGAVDGRAVELAVASTYQTKVQVYTFTIRYAA